MITFFRRALSSWLVLGLFALVLIAFIVTGVSTPTMSGDSDGAKIAKIGGTFGGESIGSAELLRRVQNQYEGARRQQPTLDKPGFLAQNGFEQVTEALINGRSMERWGQDQGFAVSKRLVDAELAGMTAFRGVTGQFDENVMRNALAQARISEKELRADIAGEIMRNQILTPTAALAPMPGKVARPYASLLLEVRTGSVGIIPLAVLVDKQLPTEAEIAAAYKANIAAYTRPEARVLRYALFGADKVAAAAAPTEADIATYYRENAATFAAKETRSLTQVIAPSQAVATTIATAAKTGGSFAAALLKAGIEASTLTEQNQASFAETAGKDIATQAFAAPKGGVIGPVKGAFGWYVVRVDSITGTPGRSLDQVRGEISAVVAREKSQEALSELAGKIEDAIADGSSFAEITKANGLTVAETQPVLANGQPVNPQAGWTPPTELNALLKTGFEAGADDKPTVETIIQDQAYALLTVGKIIPPTPVPLAQVRPLVVRDIVARKAAQRAKAIGDKIVAAVNKGTPLAKALAEAGVPLPAPAPARGSQLEMMRAQQAGKPIPEPVRALFALQKGKAKLIPAEKGDALFVTVLEQVEPGNLAAVPGLVDTTRQELSQALNSELGEEFMRAVQAEVKVKRNPEAIAAAKRQFSGQ
jgi:peptidyl-prolyl cis-trans isomerase D